MCPPENTHSHALHQEFKWRELEEQRKAERLHKRLQQEQAYLLSLQQDHKPPQPCGKTKDPRRGTPDCTKAPRSGSPDASLATTASLAASPDAAPQTAPLEPEKALSPDVNTTTHDPSAPPVPDKDRDWENMSPDASQLPDSCIPIKIDGSDPSLTPLTEHSEQTVDPVCHPPWQIREVNFLCPSPPVACCFLLPLFFSTTHPGWS